MTMNDYQNLSRRTHPAGQDWHEKLQNAALGLCGEAGEVADHIKKGLYQGHGVRNDRIAEELGDVLFYASMMADAMGLTLQDVAQGNVDKLRARYPDGFNPKRSVNREA
jgi:NTP pyrophosphatase (non-canonical NTP hydrolase)